ncbi:hypothetical protein D3C78_1297260 [compost metagenome]
MVHADVAVAGGGQLLDGALEHFQFDAGAGQVLGIDPPLRRKALGQVSVVEHRQAVRLQGDDFVDGAGEGVGRLQRQAVDQVEVDRAELQGARGFDDGAGFLEALQAVDGALHGGIEVLDAEAYTVESDLAQQAHGRPVGFARVDLDAVVAAIVVEQAEVLTQARHQLTQLVVIEKGRGAAAEVQLLD